MTTPTTIQWRYSGQSDVSCIHQVKEGMTYCGRNVPRDQWLAEVWTDGDVDCKDCLAVLDKIDRKAHQRAGHAPGLWPDGLLP